MAVNSCGQGHVGGHEHARPDDGVEPDNVLADDVAGGGPEGGGPGRGVQPADAREVVRQRVEPDVHDVFLVEALGHAHAPLEGGAADAQVPQRLLRVPEAVQDVVAVHLGPDELGVRLDVGDQPLLVVGQAEEVGLLAHALQGEAVLVLEARRLGLHVRHEGLLLHVVPALVLPQVDVPRLGALAPELAAHLLVGGVGGADVVVVRDLQALVQCLEAVDVLVAQLDGGDAQPLGRARNLLPVLVRARQEEHLLALEAVEACEHVRGHGLVGVAHVRVPVRVVDRRRHVKPLMRSRAAWGAPRSHPIVNGGVIHGLVIAHSWLFLCRSGGRTSMRFFLFLLLSLQR
mmetsp:Transcript_19789/g.31058  ORF Transcript_19789/g.31058 Transcript_19789/m.31058 type:complete len:345 (-) Transcript_19789:242-1276(-)